MNSELVSGALDTSTLLKTLMAFRDGDFSVRLPVDQTGIAELADHQLIVAGSEGHSSPWALDNAPAGRRVAALGQTLDRRN